MTKKSNFKRKFKEYNVPCMLQNQILHSKTIVISRSRQNSFECSTMLQKAKLNYIQGARLHSTVQQSPSSYAGPHSSHTKFTAAK